MFTAASRRVLKLLLAPCAMILVSLLTGCAVVVMEKPFAVSSPPVDAQLLTGDWKTQRGCIGLRFTEDGLGHFTSASWEQSTPTNERVDFITVAGKNANRYFCAQFASSDSTNVSGYVLGRYAFTATNELTFSLANVDYFTNAVAQKRLAGKLEEDRRGHKELKSAFRCLRISSPPERLLEFLDATADTNMFDTAHAETWRRATRKDADAKK